MTRSYAVLVDGGFIKWRLGSKDCPFVARDFDLFIKSLQKHPSLHGCVLHRVFFYDAVPLEESQIKPLKGGSVAFGQTQTASRNRELHRDLAKQPFLALRLGELSFRGWSLSKDALDVNESQITVTAEMIRANIQQKGVDMRVGMDIAALTLKKMAQIIVLVTGDSDFVPAMKFARREGAQLFLVPLGNHLKESMRMHSDLIIDCQIGESKKPVKPIVFLNSDVSKGPQ